MFLIKHKLIYFYFIFGFMSMRSTYTHRAESLANETEDVAHIRRTAYALNPRMIG